MQRNVLGLAFGVVLCAALAGFSSPAAAVEWNLATRLTDSVFHTHNLRLFAKDVDESTKGELKIVIHSAGSLFKHQEIKRAVQTGQVQIASIQMSSFANDDEIYNFESIPFLATTFFENQLLWEAARPVFVNRMMKDGIRVLWAEPWPPQAFYAKKELKALSDLKGVKVRTYSRIGSRLVELMGAQPVLVAAGEVQQAFSAGIVDAMITSSAFGASVQAWDFVKIYNDVGAWLGLDETIVNEREFRRLKPDHQKAVLDAAARAEARGWVMAYEADESEKAKLIANGMRIVPKNPQFMKEVRQVSEQMKVEWVKAAGPEAKKILDRYEELVKRK